MRLLTNERLSLLLTTLSLVLLSYSLLHAKLSWGLYGMLLHTFPITYPVALALLLIASFFLWRSGGKASRIALLPLLIFVFSVWLLPILLEPEGLISSSAGSSYLDTGYAYYIANTGHFDPCYRGNQMVCPAAWILYSSLFQLTGLHRPLLVLQLTPLLFVTFYLLFLIPLFKQNLKGNLWVGALAIFFVGNFVGYECFTAYSLSYLLFLPLIYLLSKVEDWEGTSQGIKLIFIIILAALVLYHGLMATLALFLLAAFFLIKRIRFPWLIVITITFIGIWMIYLAWPHLEYSLPTMWHKFLRFDIMFQQSYAGHIQTLSDECQFRYYSKLYTALLFFGIGAVGALLAFFGKGRFNKYNMTFIALSVGIAAHGSFVGLMYHSETPVRVYWTFLPCIGYFGTKWLNKKSLAILLCLLLVIAIPPRLINQHPRRGESWLPTDVATVRFFHDNVTCEHYLVSTYYARVANYVHDITLSKPGHYIRLNYSAKNSMLTLYTRRNQGMAKVSQPFYVFTGDFHRQNLEDMNKPRLMDKVEDDLKKAKNAQLLYSIRDDETGKIYRCEPP